MSDLNYQKQAQDYYGKAPVIILGSGASAAHGMSGMGALAKHLVAHTDVSGLSAAELEVWKKFCQILSNGVDLESALHQVTATEELTSRVVKATWALIEYEDIEIFQKSLQDNEIFPLSRLLEHMFKSSLKMLNIVTTNYDRLAEYACDQGRIHHYTGFTHGFFRQLAPPTEITSARRANIWKVHGSLDWFQSPLEDTVALSNNQGIPDNYQPQIVTPGTQKYQKTHLEPFRSIIKNADQAINEAGSYLCIGYGFNDEHIQPKLMVKCVRQKTPITIITYTLSESAKNLILDGKAQNYLAIERGETDGQSIVYSSLDKIPLTVEKNIWSLEGYLSLIM
ncbi:TPA: SIR2 family protein [Pseudomonas aeruginosa]|uniref:SIR2 family protein n=1 Tax=Pseudomonas aeruginosa TaxID=287 RepID=UPI00157FE225|nr:SIR2 family protein [Pseudomonas aeruginosa]QKR50758.1 SIR2 family protein [Pseudomonas aeruginosa]HBO4407161.1 SIR2 family protein [Pseudomonas aeruginosa]HCF3852260.1 SIR2 family protein [Pseudomonas aeruginosa]HDY5481242.1 SIR2 family protein [Pseudomonas aeruginosa]